MNGTLIPTCLAWYLSRGPRRGTALLTVILASVVILTVGLALATLASLNLNVSRNLFFGTRARYLAQAGIQRFAAFMRGRAGSSSLTTVAPFDVVTLYHSPALQYLGQGGVLVNPGGGYPGICQYVCPGLPVGAFSSYNNLANANPMPKPGTTDEVPPFSLDMVFETTIGGDVRFYEAVISQRWSYLLYSENSPLEVAANAYIEGDIFGSNYPWAVPLGAPPSQPAVTLAVPPSPEPGYTGPPNPVILGNLCVRNSPSPGLVELDAGTVYGEVRTGVRISHVNLSLFNLPGMPTPPPTPAFVDLAALPPPSPGACGPCGPSPGSWEPYLTDPASPFVPAASPCCIVVSPTTLSGTYNFAGSLTDRAVWCAAGNVPTGITYPAGLNSPAVLTLSDGVLSETGDIALEGLVDEDGMILAGGSLYLDNASLDSGTKPMAIIASNNIVLTGQGTYDGFIACKKGLTLTRGLHISGGILANTDPPPSPPPPIPPGWAPVLTPLVLDDTADPGLPWWIQFDPATTKGLNQFGEVRVLSFRPLQ